MYMSYFWFKDIYVQTNGTLQKSEKPYGVSNNHFTHKPKAMTM